MTTKPRKINWKRLCAEKEAENAALKLEVLALKNQINSLIRTIRDTDQIIFSISQCTSWESMRPRFNMLSEQMMVRKQAESKAIGNVIEQRLHEVYADESAALKQITKGK